jgi:hypothetical protein
MNINNLDTSPNLSVRTKFYVQSNQSISISSSKSKQFLLVEIYVQSNQQSKGLDGYTKDS